MAAVAFGACTVEPQRSEVLSMLGNRQADQAQGDYVVCLGRCPVIESVAVEFVSLPVGTLLSGDEVVGRVELRSNFAEGPAVARITPLGSDLTRVQQLQLALGAGAEELLNTDLVQFPLDLPVNIDGLVRPFSENEWMLLRFSLHRGAPVVIAGFTLDETQQLDDLFRRLPASLFSQDQYGYVMYVGEPPSDVPTVAFASNYALGTRLPLQASLLVTSNLRANGAPIDWLMTKEMVRLWARRHGEVTLPPEGVTEFYVGFDYALQTDGKLEDCYACFDPGWECPARQAGLNAIAQLQAAQSPDELGRDAYLRAAVWSMEEDFLHSVLAVVFAGQPHRLPAHLVYGGEPDPTAFVRTEYRWQNANGNACTPQTKTRWIQDRIMSPTQ